MLAQGKKGWSQASLGQLRERACPRRLKLRQSDLLCPSAIAISSGISGFNSSMDFLSRFNKTTSP